MMWRGCVVIVGAGLVIVSLSTLGSVTPPKSADAPHEEPAVVNAATLTQFAASEGPGFSGYETADKTATGFAFSEVTDPQHLKRLSAYFASVGDMGASAESNWQDQLRGLQENARATLAALSDEYHGLPAGLSAPRWLLVATAVELDHPDARLFFEEVLAEPVHRSLNAVDATGDLVTRMAALRGLERMSATDPDARESLLALAATGSCYAIRSQAGFSYVQSARDQDEARRVLAARLRPAEPEIAEITAMPGDSLMLPQL